MNSDFLLMKVKIHKRYTYICVYVWRLERSTNNETGEVSCEEDHQSKETRNLKLLINGRDDSDMEKRGYFRG